MQPSAGFSAPVLIIHRELGWQTPDSEAVLQHDTKEKDLTKFSNDQSYEPPGNLNSFIQQWLYPDSNPDATLGTGVEQSARWAWPPSLWCLQSRVRRLILDEWPLIVVSAMEISRLLRGSVIMGGHNLVWEARFSLENDTEFAREWVRQEVDGASRMERTEGPEVSGEGGPMQLEQKERGE